MRFLFLFFAMGVAHADEVPANWAVVCETSESGSAIFSEGEKVRFHLESSNRALKDLKVFDGIIDLTWKNSNCRIDKNRPLLFSCAGLAEIANPPKLPKKLQLSVTSLSSSSEYIESLDKEDSEVVHVNIGVNTANGTQRFISVPFDAKHCAKPKALGEGV